MLQYFDHVSFCQSLTKRRNPYLVNTLIHSYTVLALYLALTLPPEEEDEDNMEEITTDNIVGSRTRGKTGVDYAKAAANTEDLDDDEDDDEDFEAHEDDAMQE